MKRATTQQLRSWLPPLKSDANKYSRGQLIIVGGSAAYSGAGALASAAAERAGAGYVLVYCAPESRAAIVGFRPSVVARDWTLFSATAMAEPTPTHRLACLVGSGLDGGDEDHWGRALDVIAHAPMAVVVDGGAITALASDQGRAAAHARAERHWPLIVTPHGGEAARLAKPLGLDTSDPESLAKALSRAYEATIVLKGPVTHIAEGDDVYLMDEGGPELAKAGTGDVLAGIIGALVAQGVAPLEAGVLGATLHARAGARAAEVYGPRSVIPEDVIDALGDELSLLDE